MDRISDPLLGVSPKRFQQEGAYEQALYAFALEYVRAWGMEDEFMRSHYLDEIAHTIVLMRDRQVRRDQLEREMAEVVRRVVGEDDWPRLKDTFTADRQLALIKRYQRQRGPSGRSGDL